MSRWGALGSRGDISKSLDNIRGEVERLEHRRVYLGALATR